MFNTSFNTSLSNPLSFNPQNPSLPDILKLHIKFETHHPQNIFTITHIMSAIAVAQRKLKITQALPRQAATELISAAKLDAFRKVKAAATIEGGKRRRKKAATTGKRR